MYFVLATSSRPRRRLKTRPSLGALSWWSAAPITAPLPRPLPFVLQPYLPFDSDQAPHLGAVLETNPPVWRDDLIEALRAAGAGDFEVFDAEVTSPANTSALTDFYQALRDGGVEDVDAYLTDVLQVDPTTWADPEPRVFTHYKAVNVLRMVSAADLARSQATVHGGAPHVDVDFDRLVVDARRADGHKLFRLAESVNAVLISADVRDALLKAGFGEELDLAPADSVAV